VPESGDFILYKGRKKGCTINIAEWGKEKEGTQAVPLLLSYQGRERKKEKKT